MKVLILSMAVAVCLAPAALAGTVIKQQELTPGNATARQTVTIYLDADKLRVEGNNPSSGQYVVIFDKAKQVMWFAEPSKGTYLELTAAQVQAMGAQMQGAMSQMQEAMKQMEAEMANLPPQQRAMMEQMMKGRMGDMAGMGAPPAPKTVRQKATGQTVGRFTCTRYEVLSGSDLTEEICAAPLNAVQIDPAAFETFQALGEFYKPLLSNLPKGNWSAPTELNQIQGFPVQTISFENRKPTSEWRLVSVENQPIDAAQFTLPPGLKKTAMPPMPPQGR